MDESVNNLNDLLHLLVAKVPWFHEETRDHAHRMVDKFSPQDETTASPESDPGAAGPAAPSVPTGPTHNGPVDPSGDFSKNE